MLQNRLLCNAALAQAADRNGPIGTPALREHPAYLARQLITCIGNKRALLGAIDSAVALVKQRLGKQHLRIFDAFAGSGIVSRFFKGHAVYLVSNDLEDYAATIARCFLRNRSEVKLPELRGIVRDLNARVDTVKFPPGFIEEMYAPRSEEQITAADRVFYTRRNARRLDNYRRLLDGVADDHRELLLGPLLSEASIHANTSGVFKGFYRDRHSKLGRYGGTNGDALQRIRGEIVLEPPILSRFECECDVLQGDANEIAGRIPDLDLAYLDPPYNQHPYGSNYFMLNLLIHYRRPEHISRVSGIPADWRRSDYNKRTKSLLCFRELLRKLNAKFILISFNNEGFITREQMLTMLAELGTVTTLDVRYNTFRGCRNLKNRSIHVTEQLFLVERE